MLAQMGGTADELEKTAPADVKEDVETVLDGLGKIGEGDAGARSAEFIQAGQRVEAFRQQRCSTGDGGSGDG